MTARVDPEGREKEAVLAFAGDLAGKRVLEVGCGNGRLTWQYADLPAHVVGIDPNADRIAQAQQELPPHLQGRVEFQPVAIEAYQPSSSFDLIIFAWSL
jgi:2-polyprenyl-3-methyl-5-hydroxy-6-metoxy-1,4-benzoquinol methylase